MRASRTLRTALVAAGVTAALGVSATGAFAQSAPATKTAASAAHTSGHCKTKRVHVKTVKLADKVSRAKVFKTGKHRYEAEIWGKGLKYGTMAAQGRTAHADHNGLHITLHPNGKVTSWVERAKPRPKPVVKRVLLASAPLADGTSTANIYKVTAHHYEADVYADGTRIDTLVANGRTAYGRLNGLHVALHPNGKVTSWVERAKTRPKPVVKRVLLASAPLADGTSTANIYKVTAHHYEADVYADGTRIDTLVANGRTAYGRLNGLHVALQPDGQLSSWVDQGPTPQPDHTQQPAPIAPVTPDTPNASAQANTASPTG